VVIEVTDTGAGMDAETLDRLFDPFFTTKGWDFNKGTGLGLSVANGIVEQHGGWITCRSEPGKGTTFRIYLPAIAEEGSVEKPGPSIETVPSSKKILLVDDEEYVRELGKRILERAGYEVINASNGKEALDIYAREKSNIGLVILDLIMPHMSGEKCLEELLTINRHMKAVVSTGHSLGTEERDRIEASVKGFVSKPYQVKQFVDVVTRVMETEKMSDGLSGSEGPSKGK
jgi:two-component system, cell cycle sensor histidine kinase and response regulator CckA